MKRNCELACVSWPGPVCVVFRLNHLHLLARASDVGGLWPGGLDPAVRRSGEVMKQLKTRFEALPAETQERLKSQAKARREIARRAPSRLDESFDITVRKDAHMQCTVMGIMLDEAHRALTTKNMMMPPRIFVNTDSTAAETKTPVYYIII